MVDTVKRSELVVLEVLAGAYRGKRASLAALLTHGAIDRVGEPYAPLCRIPADSLTSTGPTLPGDAPTCPTCLRRWTKLLATATDG